MADRKIFWDLGIIETLNGGDVQLVGRDLGVVYHHENQVYLALFGGNEEGNTPSVDTGAERVEYWGNRLFYPNRADLQFNSNTERVLNTTELTSSGRIKIENAVKEDLKFLSQLGATVTVAVTIPSDNVVRIEIRTVYSEEEKILTIITLRAPLGDGDFWRIDFDNDFY